MTWIVLPLKIALLWYCIAVEGVLSILLDGEWKTTIGK